MNLPAELLVLLTVASWVLLIILGLAVLSLARLVGQLQLRLGPAGALVTEEGPAIGEMLHSFMWKTVDGRTWTVTSPSDRVRLLIYVSPTCPVCDQVVRAARTLGVRYEDGVDLEVVFMLSMDDTALATRYQRHHKIERFVLLADSRISADLRVGGAPYAFCVDRSGYLRAKGVVNTREHLESLLNAEALGFSSLQEAVDATEGKHG